MKWTMEIQEKGIQIYISIDIKLWAFWKTPSILLPCAYSFICDREAQINIIKIMD